MGSEGLEKELSFSGIRSYGKEDNGKVLKMAGIGESKLEVNPCLQAVVCGFDDYFNYHKIAVATQIILKTGRLFGTNIDRTFRVNGTLFPGSYTFISALETSSNTKATIVTKPSTFSLDLIKGDFNISDEDTKRIIMIGDNLETDMRFAENCGIDSILLFTGVTNIEEYKNGTIKDFDKLPKPTFLMESLNL